jgi:hypothetical protein
MNDLKHRRNKEFSLRQTTASSCARAFRAFEAQLSSEAAAIEKLFWYVQQRAEKIR